jgi:hypothetical protein
LFLILENKAKVIIADVFFGGGGLRWQTLLRNGLGFGRTRIVKLQQFAYSLPRPSVCPLQQLDNCWTYYFVESIAYISGSFLFFIKMEQ